MKHIGILMLLISLSRTNDINHAGKEKSSGAKKQKKQFVNFINDDGEYARNLVDLTSNEADGFDDLFRGRGGGGSMGGGSMQLTENSMGGLALEGDNMEAAYNQMGAAGGGNAFTNAFDDNTGVGDQRTVVHIYPALRRRHQLSRWFICRANNVVLWLKLKCASSPMGQPVSPDMYSNDGFGGGAALGGGGGYTSSNPSSFFGSFDVNSPGQDILSPFYNSESKLEDNINLSDNIGNSNQVDVNSFNDALQGLNTEHTQHEGGFGSLLSKPKSKATSNSDVFSNELGDNLESSDEKLQKLLESSIGNDGDGNGGGTTVGGFLSALLSQQGNGQGQGYHPQHIGQQQGGQPMQDGSNYDVNANQQAQQNALNQLSGTLTQGEMPMQAPVTVHVHASDKPMGHKNTPPGLPDESRAVAQQAQDVAMKQHKAKLAKLKKRLALLRQKLTELEDEQSKKSTKNSDPKETRKDAIKRILIKNLKLAAMIASKEVQIEESKSHELESMTRRKEEDNSITEGGGDTSKFIHTSLSKPVTELSKKAEDEVNHLTSIDRARMNNTLHRKSAKDSKLVDALRESNTTETSGDTKTESPRETKAATNETKPSTKSDTKSDETFQNAIVTVGKSTLTKINETLQGLENEKSRTQESAPTSPFLNKLRTQITSMSPDQIHGMEKDSNNNKNSR